MNVRGILAGAVLGLMLAGVAVAQESKAPAEAGAKPAAKAPAVEKKPRTPADALTPVPNGARAPQRHAGFMKRKTEGPIDLLFVGDSITDGWPGKSPETWATWQRWQVADFGVSGDRTEHVLWRFGQGELDDLPNVKCVVLLIGTNNIGHFEDERPEWAAAGVKKVLDEIHEKLPQAKVLLMAVFPRGMKDSSARKRVDELNPMIAKFADDRTTFVDIGQKFLDENGEIPKDLMPDLLHPSAKGYVIWRDAIEPKVAAIMGAPTAPGTVAAAAPATQPAVAVDVTKKEQVEAAVDKDVALAGHVESAQWSSTGKMMIIKFTGGPENFRGTAYQKQREALDKAFDGDFAKAIADKDVLVTGKVQKYKGTNAEWKDVLEIHVTKPDQVKVQTTTKAKE
jgi:lysophospholipase L1-like esterase